MTILNKMFEAYNHDRYQKELRSMSIPSALWAQLQEIEKYREAVRAACLQLVNTDEDRTKLQQLLIENEKLIIRWHRLFLDSTAGMDAIKASNLGQHVDSIQ